MVAGDAEASADRESVFDLQQNGNSSANADVTWLRREWRFASVIHFCRIFSEALGIRPFSADQLEAAIVNAGSQRVMISELLYKLARRSTDKPATVTEAASWQQLLSERFRRKHADKFGDNPLQERDWFSLSSPERLNVLLALCEWRLQDCTMNTEARGTVPAVKGDALQPTAIGEDSDGARYFFLSDGGQDCWLYRERPPPMGWPEGDSRIGQGSWGTACTTLDGIKQLARSFQQSVSSCEQALYGKLARHIIPCLEESAEASRRMEGKGPALEAAPSGLQVTSHPLQVSEAQIHRGDDREGLLAKVCEVEQEEQRGEERRLSPSPATALSVVEAQKAPAGGAEKSAEASEGVKVGDTDEQAAGKELGSAKSTSGSYHEETETARMEFPGKTEEAVREAEQAVDEGSHPTAADTGTDAKAEEESKPGVEGIDRALGAESASKPALALFDTSHPVPRKREHSQGWSPLGFEVPTGARKLETKPVSKISALVAVAKGRAEMAPKRSWHSEETMEPPYPEPPKHGILVVKAGGRHRPSQKAREMDIAAEEEEEEEPAPHSRTGPRAHLSRHRPSRKRKEMDDVDYEEEEESESYSDSDSDGASRPKSRAKRSQAHNTAKAAAARRRQQEQEQQQTRRQQQQAPLFIDGPSAAEAEYQRSFRKLQEYEHAHKQNILAKFPHACPERNHYLRQLHTQLQEHAAALQARYRQTMEREAKSRQAGGQALSFSSDLSQASAQALASQKAAQEQQMAAQRQQQLMQVAQHLTLEQRHQLQLMPPQQQVLYLERVRQQQQMLQQQQAALEQQRLQEDKRLQQHLHQQVLATLSPDQILTLRRMPPERQHEALGKLTQQFMHQQQQQQRSQVMQQQMGSGGMLGRAPGGDIQVHRMGVAGARMASPSVNSALQHGSPVLRTSSAGMSSPLAGGMLRQEPVSRGVEPSLPSAGAFGMQGTSMAQRWGLQQQAALQRIPGMIPTSEHGFAQDVSRPPMVGTGLLPGLQGRGSPLVAGQASQACTGMGPPGWQNLRQAQFPGSRLGAGSPVLPQHVPSQFPQSVPVPQEPAIPHIGDEFDDLDSMLADEFSEKLEEAPLPQPVDARSDLQQPGIGSGFARDTPQVHSQQISSSMAPPPQQVHDYMPNPGGKTPDMTTGSPSAMDGLGAKPSEGLPLNKQPFVTADVVADASRAADTRPAE